MNKVHKTHCYSIVLKAFLETNDMSGSYPPSRDISVDASYIDTIRVNVYFFEQTTRGFLYSHEFL